MIFTFWKTVELAITNRAAVIEFFPRFLPGVVPGFDFVFSHALAQ